MLTYIGIYKRIYMNIEHVFKVWRYQYRYFFLSESSSFFLSPKRFITFVLITAKTIGNCGLKALDLSYKHFDEVECKAIELSISVSQYSFQLALTSIVGSSELLP